MGFSSATEKIIAESRWIAEKLGNDFVGLEHFLLAYNKFFDGSLQELKVSVSDKKALINNVKGVKWGKAEHGNFPITKDYEFALFNGKFSRWMLGDKKVEPKHVHLSIFLINTKYKKEYLSILKNNQIKITGLKKLIVNIQFNKLLRFVGIAKLVRVFF